MIGRDAIMAARRKFEPPAQATAMNPRDDGFRKTRDAIEHLLTFGREALGFGRRAQLDEFFDIGAGDAVVLFAGEKRDALYARVVRQGRKARDKLVFHRARDDVDRMAFEIQHHDRDAVADVPRDGGSAARGGGGASVAIIGAPGPWRIPSRPGRTPR